MGVMGTWGGDASCGRRYGIGGGGCCEARQHLVVYAGVMELRHLQQTLTVTCCCASGVVPAHCPGAWLGLRSTPTSAV